MKKEQQAGDKQDLKNNILQKQDLNDKLNASSDNQMKNLLQGDKKTIQNLDDKSKSGQTVEMQNISILSNSSKNKKNDKPSQMILEGINEDIQEQKEKEEEEEIIVEKNEKEQTYEEKVFYSFHQFLEKLNEINSKNVFKNFFDILVEIEFKKTLLKRYRFEFEYDLRKKYQNFNDQLVQLSNIEKSQDKEKRKKILGLFGF